MSPDRVDRDSSGPDDFVLELLGPGRSWILKNIAISSTFLGSLIDILGEQPCEQRRTEVMKEIIYIQAGNTSNHVGTHFWNVQQSYFDYSGDKEVLVDHDVSFREGVSPRVCHLPYVRFTAPCLQ